MCAQRATASAEGREATPRPRLKRSERSEPKTGRGEATGPRARTAASEEQGTAKEEGDGDRTREHLKRSDRREPKANDAAHATDDQTPTTDTHHHTRHPPPPREGGTGGGARRGDAKRRRAGRPPKRRNDQRERHRSARQGALMGRGAWGEREGEGPPKAFAARL